MESAMERRARSDRRQKNDGPPKGAIERRTILERRILSIAQRSFAEWLAEPQPMHPKDRLVS